MDYYSLRNLFPSSSVLFQKAALAAFILWTAIGEVSADILCEYRPIFSDKIYRFECDNWDYCCGNSCCRTSSHFFRLWYFWFVIILIILLCSAGGYWWRRRIILRRAASGTPIYANGAPVIYQVSGAYPGAGTVTILQAPGTQIPGHFPGAAYNPPTRVMTTTTQYPPASSQQPSQTNAQAPPPAYNELYK